jgi:hypothetical protein
MAQPCENARAVCVVDAAKWRARVVSVWSRPHRHGRQHAPDLLPSSLRLEARRSVHPALLARAWRPGALAHTIEGDDAVVPARCGRRLP